MKRLLTLLSMLAITWSVAATPAAAQPQQSPQWDDEPNELSWEFFANDLRAARLWQAWWDKQPQDRKHTQRAAAMSALQSDLIFQAEGAPETSLWKVTTYEGRRVLRGPAGHNTSPARLVINVPEGGTYRLWTRWYNLASHRNSLSIRVRPLEAQSVEQGWNQPDAPNLLEYRAGFVPTKNRKTPAYIEEDLSQRGWHWTGSPLFALPQGQYIIEWSGMIHEGPYTSRNVDLFLLTQDPLYTPDDAADLPDSKADDAASLATTRQRPAAGDDNARQAWAMRPGTQPLHTASPELAQMWQAFRDELIARLAVAGDEEKAAALNLSHDEKYLAQLFYFDHRWNLIGTPAQVAARVAELNSPQNRVTGYFNWIEAETLNIDSGWAAVGDTSASYGHTLQASYGNGAAKASTSIDIPAAGKHRVWVRYARIKPYHNTFEITVTQAGATPHVQKYHELPPDTASGSYHYVWESFDLDLAAGKCQIDVTKNLGKPPYAYRKIDSIIVTADLNWQPSGTDRPVIPSGKEEWFAWVSRENDHWNGFGSTSRPLAPQEVVTQPVKLDVQPGAVAQRVIHISNDTKDPVTLTPAITGSLPADWRVAASQYHYSAGWQPMPLLYRHSVTVQPGMTGSLWVNIDARDAAPGQYAVTLQLSDGRDVVFNVNVTGVDIRKATAPYVGGWMAPPHIPAGYETMHDIGLTILHGRIVSKAHMNQYGIKLIPIMLGHPKDAQEVHDAVKAIHSRGLDYSDWAWIISDEPSMRTYEKWVAAAKVIRAADPKVRIWCNPGEIQSSKIEAVTAMAPYIDIFCPYINHFGAKDEAYQKLLATTGDIKLLYTTPCFQEKTPAAPLALLSLATAALERQRDGWDAFSLFTYYSYAASAWDEVSAPFPDQAVSLYPAAHSRIIGSRNLEAVRQAIVIYKTGKLQQK